MTTRIVCPHRLTLAMALALSVTSGSALGAVYKWQDATGRVQLSDQPPKDVDAEILQVIPSTMQGAQTAPAADQGGAQYGGNPPGTRGLEGVQTPENTGGRGASSAAASASAGSDSHEKPPAEIARENRKISQAKREECNATLTKLLSRGNTTRASQPTESLRKELRDNCR